MRNCGMSSIPSPPKPIGWRRRCVTTTRLRKLEKSRSKRRFAKPPVKPISMTQRRSSSMSSTRTAQANKTLFDDFLKQAKITQADATFEPQDARIITPAAVPRTPSAPQKMQFMEVALFFGLLTGVGGAFAKEKLRSASPRRKRSKINSDCHCLLRSRESCRAISKTSPAYCCCTSYLSRSRSAVIARQYGRCGAASI